MGTNKALYPFQGQAMADHIGQRLIAAGCTQVFQVCKNPLQELQTFPQIYDQLAIQHPLSGVARALHHSSHEFALIIPCDLPFVRIESLRRLLQFSQPCVVTKQPLLGIFPKKWASRALDYALHGKSVRHFSTSCSLLDVAENERKNMNCISDFGDSGDYD